MQAPSDTPEAILRRFIETAWNQRKPAGALVAPGYRTHMLQHDVVEKGDEVGPRYVETDVAHWTTAFPDLLWRLEGVVSQGTTVVARLQWEGTHQGDFLGLAATGLKVSVQAVYMAHVDDRWVTEGWLLFDRLGLLQQLGALPDTRTIIQNAASRVRCFDVCTNRPV